MLISGSDNLSHIKTCLKTAHNFHLSEDDVYEIFETQKEIIEKHWDDVCEEAQLSEVEKETYGEGSS